MHTCEWCGKRFTVPKRDEKYFGLGTPEFCAIDCIRQYVEDKSRLNEDHGLWRKIMQLAPGDTGIGGLSYSPMLGQSFRSGYEAIVAEVMLGLWGWSGVFYEPHALKVEEKRTYIPDFYLARWDVWLEVKGNWRSGDKKKFIQASELLGKNRTILLPNFYWKHFKNAVKGLRDTGGGILDVVK